MRSRIVTPEEMRHLFGAEVSHFTYAFALTRREKRSLESGQPSPLSSDIRKITVSQKTQSVLALPLSAKR